MSDQGVAAPSRSSATADGLGTDQPCIVRYEMARRRAVEWSLAQMDDQGFVGRREDGYRFSRAPWAFALAGETAAAVRVCEWIRRHMLTPDGTIGGPYRVIDEAYAYLDAALITGAHLVHQYDLSYGLLPNLLRWQDLQSGAFSGDRLPGGGMSDRMDIPYTCGPGFACLATGQLEPARAVARHLRRIYEAQPALPHRFYYSWSRSGQRLITDFADEERYWCLVDSRVAADQRWAVGGIAAAFLSRLYLADPDPGYIDLARKYQAFSMDATDAQFEYVNVCKSSWGSALLYQITGERAYREWSLRMGDWYLGRQHSDGSWHRDDEQSLGDVIELTLEFTIHLDTLIGALASRSCHD